MRIGSTGERQAFVAAPAEADSEQLQPVDEGGAVAASCSSNENRPDEPLKSRFHIFMAGAVGQGGVEHQPDLAAARSAIRATLSALSSCCFSRTAMVRRPREASQASSGETAMAEIPGWSLDAPEMLLGRGRPRRA